MFVVHCFDNPRDCLLLYRYGTTELNTWLIDNTGAPHNTHTTCIVAVSISFGKAFTPLVNT